MKNFLKSKKGNYIQILMLLPIYLVLIFLIAIEINYEAVRDRAENDARIILRSAIRKESYPEGIEKIKTLMTSKGYSFDENENLTFYHFDDSTASWSSNFVVDGVNTYENLVWSEGNIIELHFYTRTAVKQSVTDICVGSNCVEVIKSKIYISVRMIIEGGD